MKLQKLGGYASIILVCTSVASGLLNSSMFRGLTDSSDAYDPTKMMAAYQASPIHFWVYYILGILSGILTLLIALALKERMQAAYPTITTWPLCSGNWASYPQLLKSR